MAKTKPRQCAEAWCRRFVANGRNFCNRCAQPCWCPCNCGCKEPDGIMNPSGLCSDCEEGNHEVPPKTTDLVEKLLPLHEAIVANYRAVLGMRRLEEQLLKEHNFDEVDWDGKEVIAYRGYPPMCAADPDTSLRARDFEPGSPTHRAFEELTMAYRKVVRTGIRYH